MIPLARQLPGLLRPHVYSEAMGQLVVDAIAGGLSLIAVCALPGFPTPRTLRKWCREYPEFERDVTTAEHIRAERLIDEALDIADDSSGDYVTVTRKDGREERVFEHEHASRAKLRVEMRKWIASKLHRRVWGDSKQVDISAKILTINLTDDELDRQLLQAADKLRVINPQPIDNKG